MFTSSSGKIGTGVRNVRKSAGRWFSLSALLPLVLLALPNCAFPVGGLSGGVECQPGDVECEQPAPVFQPGENPADAIFCDIPKPLEANDDGCATKEEAYDSDNISLAEAATSLVNGDFKSFALDFSAEALAKCNGLPKKIKYFDEFPEGVRVCINCGTQIPKVYASTKEACAAKCEDLVNQAGIIPPEGAAEFCFYNAKLSTNHVADMCYGGACNGGIPDLSWVDPRKSPEPVLWIDHIGTDDAGGTNNLERKAATTGGTTADFNAGAASAQLIKRGDAWVEFEAGDAANTVHVLGLRKSVLSVGDPCLDPVNCPDTDPHIEAVGFAIDLNADGQVYVLEPNPDPAIKFDVHGPFGPYAVGERYRVRVTDNNDGTASISYHRLVAGFQQPAFATNTSADPSYPLRVDTTFREQGARVSNVTIVRIK